MDQRAPEQDEVIQVFLDQFARFKEGRRLFRTGEVKWDRDERCFKVRGHPITFNKDRGFLCACADQRYRSFLVCKHLAAMMCFMIGYEGEEFP